ncbi:MAG: hypothetical protein FWC39_00550 [Bacteroidetes bacterium]|nr:hypothetical protein [Bacteroidota bacterium]
MKFFFYGISFIFVLAACNRPAQTPVVFSLQTDNVSMTLQLNADKTFSYKTKHIKSVAFNEEGTYTVTDSSVILDYTNPSYSYNCFEIPLDNDTFLLVKYKKTMYLVHANQPSEEHRKIFMKNLMQSIKNHTFNLFEEDLYMPHTGGDLSPLNPPQGGLAEAKK